MIISAYTIDVKGHQVYHLCAGGMMLDKITIVIADDHAILREGLRGLLGEYDDILVVDEATNGAEAVQKTTILSPDILLLDLMMPSMGGVEVLEALAAENLSTKVIVLTGADDDELLARSIQSGAKGFLLKDAASGQLVDAIRSVASGGVWLPHDLTQKLFAGISRKGHADSAKLSLLTAREVEVFKLIAEAKSNAEIAQLLFISEHTVKVHVSRILEKLELSSRSEVLRFAIRIGIVKA
jgi:DNA-binding NarL/FixJ family response regulator